jgi:hypothetical protein
VSNGGSDSHQEQETSGSDFGTTFTVNVAEIELTDEQLDNISSEIIRAIIERIEMRKLPEIVAFYRRGYRRGELPPPGWYPGGPPSIPPIP